MPRIALFAGGDLSNLPSLSHFDLYVGVDRGCLFILEQGLPLDWAVGDFDSVTVSEREKISAVAGQMYQSPSEKDDTDTELALKRLFATYPEAEVTVFGAFGGRIDHLLSNLFLPSDPDLSPFMTQINLVDAQNHVTYQPAGQHLIFLQEGKTYVSFLVEGEGDLQILGAKYDLTPANFFTKKIYSSNEFLSGPIEISLSDGYVVVMQTKDRRAR